MPSVLLDPFGCEPTVDVETRVALDAHEAAVGLLVDDDRLHDAAVRQD
jgi:hypothetical protein